MSAVLNAPARAAYPSKNHVLVLLLMAAALALAMWLKPSRFWADKVGMPDLEAVIPHQFGDWVESAYGARSIVNPQQAEALRNIYSSILARTYVNTKTNRIVMLSIAYGRDQTRDTALHAPEACYSSQGFRVERNFPVDLKLAGMDVPAKRLDTTMGVRHELVTYWIRVGDRLSRGSLSHNLIRMRFAAMGYIADGLLFRVSEVTKEAAADSYQLQDGFLDALLSSMTPAGRASLTGVSAR